MFQAGKMGNETPRDGNMYILPLSAVLRQSNGAWEVAWTTDTVSCSMTVISGMKERKVDF